MKKITLLFALLASVMSANATDKTMSEEEIIELIKPVGRVHLAGQETAQAEPVHTGPRTGEQLYNTFCTACHGAGVLGAPKKGNAGDWAPRLEKGMDAVLARAISGFNAMPAKGSCGDCTDDEIKGAIEYMTAGL